MTVHSTTLRSLEMGMPSSTPTEALPFASGDAEWVADLLDTYRSGDLDAVAAQLEELTGVVRRAAKARSILAGVDPDLLRAGLRAASSRGGAP